MFPNVDSLDQYAIGRFDTSKGCLLHLGNIELRLDTEETSDNPRFFLNAEVGLAHTLLGEKALFR